MSTQRRQNYKLTNCQGCGKPFRAARAHAKYCSPACRVQASRVGRFKKRKSETNVTLQQLELLLRKYGAN